MATWINILDCIYPVGSLYFSVNSTSPASTVGGSWTKVIDAVIAASGSNFADAMNYGGNKKITVNQIPPHKHDLKIHYNNGSITGEYGAEASSTGDVLAWRDIYIDNTGGGRFLPLPLCLQRILQNSLSSKEVCNGLLG